MYTVYTESELHLEQQSDYRRCAVADEKYTRNDGTEIPDMVRESEEAAMRTQSKSDMETIIARMNDVKEGRASLLTREEVKARL